MARSPGAAVGRISTSGGATAAGRAGAESVRTWRGPEAWNWPQPIRTGFRQERGHKRVSDQEIQTLVILAVVLLTPVPAVNRAADTFQVGCVSARK